MSFPKWDGPLDDDGKLYFDTQKFSEEADNSDYEDELARTYESMDLPDEARTQAADLRMAQRALRQSVRNAALAEVQAKEKQHLLERRNVFCQNVITATLSGMIRADDDMWEYSAYDDDAYEAVDRFECVQEWRASSTNVLLRPMKELEDATRVAASKKAAADLLVEALEAVYKTMPLSNDKVDRAIKMETLDEPIPVKRIAADDTTIQKLPGRIKEVFKLGGAFAYLWHVLELLKAKYFTVDWRRNDRIKEAAELENKTPNYPKRPLISHAFEKLWDAFNDCESGCGADAILEYPAYRVFNSKAAVDKLDERTKQACKVYNRGIAPEHIARGLFPQHGTGKYYMAREVEVLSSQFNWNAAPKSDAPDSELPKALDRGVQAMERCLNELSGDYWGCNTKKMRRLKLTAKRFCEAHAKLSRV